MPKEDLKLNDEIWIVNIDQTSITKGKVTRLVRDLENYQYVPEGIKFTYEVTLDNTETTTCLGFTYPNCNSSYLPVPFKSIEEATAYLVNNLDDHINWYQSRLNVLQTLKQKLLDQLEIQTDLNKQLELDLELKT